MIDDPHADIGLRASQALSDLSSKRIILTTVLNKVGMANHPSGYQSGNPQADLYNAIDQLCEAHARAQVYQIMASQDFYHLMMMSAGAPK